MEIQRMIGLEMILPEGKPPGFYAHIVKGIADSSPPYDRFKELLIYESEAQLPQALEVLEHYRVPSEHVALLLLPADLIEQGDLYEDYAIVTRNGNAFIDLSLTAVFALNAAKPEAEAAPALLQLKEHLVASLTVDGEKLHLVDRQLAELAERIAKAYGCGLRWLYE
ncbi:hypothetical protein D7Z26_08555 [Cohnella endophytica]|uniref:Uncharacterized protein n=1 Tax=Cohnella endophytica TaxID=2419778 RepID=A0A494Y5Q0_9BACL|nr:hypothetical protein [Cohnella endophytica]RKP55250.1 hypothetical protein D7Z26_08555 [Cohnella endophytica]